ncbi:hypothetical protein KC19_6G026200 [Ceratodon purpureus]|uniref:Uncharacterized protein n=1 Tax=Ceratodon purpureus TaxID=3225 RepID=A0A8T0H9K1_CERPU|nr:hypothetical protein KC19_6G026200 [Ceratodon purpureus]
MLDISRYGSWSTMRFKLHDIADYAECPTNNKRITAQEFSLQSVCLAKNTSAGSQKAVTALQCRSWGGLQRVLIHIDDQVHVSVRSMVHKDQSQGKCRNASTWLRSASTHSHYNERYRRSNTW